MDCKEFRELLDLYVDGELSPEAMTAASVHLSECAPCRRVKAELLVLRRALKSVVAQHQPPPELAGNVHYIYQATWRKLFFQARKQAIKVFDSLSTRRQPTGSRNPRAKTPLWKRRVALPAPVFALLLLCVFALALWSIVLRPAEAPRPPVTTKGRDTQTASAPPQPAREAFDISRYDRGQRASIYKVRREQSADAAQ
jgi:Putative zinc-finger